MNIKIDLYSENYEINLKKLLSEDNLPIKDLTSEKLQNFLVARSQDNSIIGTIGIELMEEVGLLRSLVIHPSHRGRGLGKLLTHELEAFARNKGVKRLYLLTKTASDFFLGLSYSTILRASVPKDIANTEQFSNICPSSAICMTKKITIA